jgi:hypothetical protein
LTLGGADLNGYYFSTHYAADNAAPVAKKFIEDYEKAYGAKPDDVAALTYDAFGLLFNAIKNAGKADRESIRAALSTLPSYKGVTGDMKFQADSRDPIKSAVILQIKDGKFTYFTNANPESVSSSGSERFTVDAQGGPNGPPFLLTAGIEVGNDLERKDRLLASANAERFATGQHLRPDRSGLHHGLWHSDHDQFRPWRCVHDRGVFLFSAATVYLGLPFAPTLLLTMLGTALLGVLIERLAYKPLRHAPRVSAIITALGLGCFWKISPWPWPPIPSIFLRCWKTTWDMGGVSLSSLQVIIIFLSLGLMFLLDYVVHRTPVGNGDAGDFLG